MEAAFIYNNLYPDKSFKEILKGYFTEYSPQETHYLFLKIFQCWGVNECTIRTEISNEEVALFFDQLIDLVAAAYILHQANRVPETGQEGNGHE